ncbi:MAG: response regulator, partial [Dethiobacteria bacterium]|nr:response regulator [Dethiobacteria bacterium]
MTEITEKVLLVDDERSVLLACRRHLYGHYDFYSAENGEQALATISRDGPFAVIVSDYRMPKMNGLALLTEVAETAPDTVRILLTGYADIEVALEAINRGKIFRLLTKPTSSDELLHAVQDGVKQYRLITSERELLKNTVSGSVKILTEIFSMTNPVAFGQAVRISRLAKVLAQRLAFDNAWEIELASILSQIGTAAVPAHILEKMSTGKGLNDEEMSIF